MRIPWMPPKPSASPPGPAGKAVSAAQPARVASNARSAAVALVGLDTDLQPCSASKWVCPLHSGLSARGSPSSADVREVDTVDVQVAVAVGVGVVVRVADLDGVL